MTADEQVRRTLDEVVSAVESHYADEASVELTARLRTVLERAIERAQYEGEQAAAERRDRDRYDGDPRR